MAAKRDEDGLLDDIELLNIHRYPESVPASLVAQVRNSKTYQKRLEDLLKGMATGRKNRVEVPQDPARPPEENAGEPTSLRSLLKKFMP